MGQTENNTGVYFNPIMLVILSDVNVIHSPIERQRNQMQIHSLEYRNVQSGEIEKYVMNWKKARKESYTKSAIVDTKAKKEKRTCRITWVNSPGRRNNFKSRCATRYIASE